ncbi:Ig-like domain-containing protein [bacterium]|nr:Ig-like domain-containing protein [Flavobacteriaceae bacterium]MDC0118095.1 Ig-like domain-containing protein [bacterium]
MKQALLFATAFLLFFSCVETDYVNDRVDPKIFISNPLLELKKGGDEYPFQIDYFNYVGKQVENPKVSWTSSDPAILEITEDGLATGIDFGTATVTATLITSEEAQTIISRDEVIVSMATLKESLEFVGKIISTSSYQLGGSYALTALNNGGIKLTLKEDYEASTSLPGLYIYLGNNPKSIADAHEIGPVTVFKGTHFYDLPTLDIYDYNYILYWCKPFGVKVGEGQIK